MTFLLRYFDGEMKHKTSNIRKAGHITSRKKLFLRLTTPLFFTRILRKERERKKTQDAPSILPKTCLSKNVFTLLIVADPWPKKQSEIGAFFRTRSSADSLLFSWPLPHFFWVRLWALSCFTPSFSFSRESNNTRERESLIKRHLCFFLSKLS